jgi:cytochrome P450
VIVMLASRPDNVPAERVVDFDIYNIPGSDTDVQLAYRAFQQDHPDIFWTPRNGGHWVATRAEDIETMQRDYEHFSNQRIVIPLMPPQTPRQIPLEVDPPEHAPYRRVLTLALLPREVDALDGKVREATVALIEAFRGTGECEFIEAFAKQLPINVFLDLVDLPRADRVYLLPITEESVRAPTVERRQAAHEAVAGYLMKWILARREQPGNDLLSKIVNTDVNGARISLEEAISFSVLVLFGGLDTVATMLGFIARFLALNPAHRREITAHLHDGKFMRGAIEELIRRHGISNTARIIPVDYEYKGVSFRKGDLVLPPNLLFGLDERKVDDPLKVDFNRPFPPPHAAFGHGPHACPGAMLARREIKIFLQEWLTRIPDYEITPGSTPKFGTGMVNGILSLNLSWRL